MSTFVRIVDMSQRIKLPNWERVLRQSGRTKSARTVLAMQMVGISQRHAALK